MLWLHPFTKAAGTVPLPCSHVLGAATLGKQGGQGMGLAGTGGTWAEKEGTVAAERWQYGRGWNSHRTLLLNSSSWHSQSTFPQPTQWQGCHNRGAAGMRFRAVCQGQHSALTLLGWCVRMNHWCWQS